MYSLPFSLSLSPSLSLGLFLFSQRQSYYDPAFIAFFVVWTMYVMLLLYWMYFKEHNSYLNRFAWGSCSGTLMGLQNFLKDILTIAKATERQEEQGEESQYTLYYPWIFYLFIVVGGPLAFMGLVALSHCMKRYDATYSNASYVGSFVIVASIMSAIHYDTFQNLHSIRNYIMYPIGLIVLMVGVYILANNHNGEDSDERIEDGDDAEDDKGNVYTNAQDEQRKEVVEMKEKGQELA